MIKIKTEKEREEIISYLIDFKEKQAKISETDLICFAKLSLYLALKNKIFFKNLLLHPVIFTTEPFYVMKSKIIPSELELLLTDLLEYELTEKESFLTKDELDKVIKLHTKLKTKREKNESVSTIQINSNI